MTEAACSERRTLAWMEVGLPLEHGETHLASPRTNRYRRPYKQLKTFPGNGSGPNKTPVFNDRFLFSSPLAPRRPPQLPHLSAARWRIDHGALGAHSEPGRT